MKFVILVAIISVAYADDKVIGGAPIVPGYLPSIANLRRYDSLYCGGSIIDKNFVLSAAHCYTSSSIIVYVGDHSLTTIETTEQGIAADLLIRHESFNYGTLQNDVMLVRLSRSISFDDNVYPATLPSKPLQAGELCEACGWGTIHPTASAYPDEPHCVDGLKVISRTECNLSHIYGGSILPGMVCIGDLAGGKDSCQGDSGGPIYTGSGSDHVLVGSVSWGSGCAEANKPGVYSDLYYFDIWIQQTVFTNRP